MEIAAIFKARFGAAPAAAARAPGRVNLIGEHTDYNGGRVLPVAIERETHVAVRLRGDAAVLGHSAALGEASADLGDDPAGHWLDYPRGVARVLAEAGSLPATGFEVAVTSDVPTGAGLSSSAALEAATAVALLGAAGVPVRDRPELARLCQRAEQRFAGVPCGLMDPFAVLCATAGSAVLLDCATEQARAIPLPTSIALVIIDTEVRHDLRAGGYAERRAACDRALAAARATHASGVAHLAALSVAELEAVVDLDASTRRRARHVITENGRVLAFVDALTAGDIEAAGVLMYASHASLAGDFEVTVPESDALVAASHEIPGCRGARMTGAGWGGCTVHLVDAASVERVESALCERFEAAFGRRPPAFRTRPSPGASRL